MLSDFVNLCTAAIDAYSQKGVDDGLGREAQEGPDPSPRNPALAVSWDVLTKMGKTYRQRGQESRQKRAARFADMHFSATRAARLGADAGI